jgi:hypothetical protein
MPKPLAEDAKVEEGTVLNLAVSEGKVIATVAKVLLADEALLDHLKHSGMTSAGQIWAHPEPCFPPGLGRDFH